MSATILLLPAVLLSGALFLAAVGEDAAASALAKKSDCVECKSTTNPKQAPSIRRPTSPDRFMSNRD